MATAGDNPINSKNDDLLRRAPVATALAREIRRVDSSEGYVFGVIGPWGSGKTSVLNMMQEELNAEPAYTVVNFNPWMFSGTEQLVEGFFHELSSQLKESNREKFGNIASTIDTYANLFSPLSLVPWVGAWYDRFLKVTKAARQYAESNRSSVNAKRNELRKLLSQLDQPIVITIDDIDRLSSSEIKDLFKLVRLTGNFPNLVYVLAFDRQRVEEALKDSGVEGRAYLEKIVQQGVRVPDVSKGDLITQLGDALSEATSDIEEFTHFNQNAWADLLAEVVAPLVRNMRDVRRYAASFGTVARDLGDSMEVADLLALEAVRVFLPDRFELLAQSQDALTTYRERQQAEYEGQIKAIVEGDEPTHSVMTSLIKRVFPHAARYVGGTMYDSGWESTWLRERRAAHADILHLYFERTAPEALSYYWDAEKAYSMLERHDELDTFLRSLDVSSLDRVVSALQHFEQDFTKASVVPASTVLLNLIDSLPDGPRRSFFHLEPEARVRITVYRLLQKLESAGETEDAVAQILPNLPTLSSKFLLISLVGHRDGIGHKLVPEDAETALESTIVADISAASAETLAKEWDVLRILSTPVYWELRESPVLSDFSYPPLHKAVLLKAQSHVASQMVGNRAVDITTRLHWETLERIYGDTGGLQRAIESVETLATDNDEELNSVVALAKKYLEGWRPESF
ncbi:KAP family P-loop NTPase fold protein [Mycobacterium sp. BMJ-28]